MLTGKSVFHVNQTLGKYFSNNELCGYFNSMIEKVTKQPEFLKEGILPSYKNSKGEDFVFPVAVIQYGLGCYDLYLETNDDVYLKKTFECADWILSIQRNDGGIPNFIDEHKDEPFGAMCQGEAASLLLRCYLKSNKKDYLIHAKTALDFMLVDKANGGTSIYSDNKIVLLEFTFSEPVLNGWIFAFFGIFDYLLIQKDDHYLNIYEKAFDTIVDALPSFDCGYWSMYDLSGRIASPFYHRLHIAQLEAIYLISNNDIVLKYLSKWKKCSKNPFKKIRAFMRKAFQKIRD